MTVLERRDNHPRARPSCWVLGTPIDALMLALLFRKSQGAIPCAPSGFRPEQAPRASTNPQSAAIA